MSKTKRNVYCQHEGCNAELTKPEKHFCSIHLPFIDNWGKSKDE